jgi:hypothetical protein
MVFAAHFNGYIACWLPSGRRDDPANKRLSPPTHLHMLLPLPSDSGGLAYSALLTQRRIYHPTHRKQYSGAMTATEKALIGHTTILPVPDLTLLYRSSLFLHTNGLSFPQLVVLRTTARLAHQSVVQIARDVYLVSFSGSGA